MEQILGGCVDWSLGEKAGMNQMYVSMMVQVLESYVERFLWENAVLNRSM